MQETVTHSPFGESGWGGSVEVVGEFLKSGDWDSFDLATDFLGAEGMGLAAGVKVQIPWLSELLGDASESVDDALSKLFGGPSKSEKMAKREAAVRSDVWNRGIPPAYMKDLSSDDKFFFEGDFYFKHPSGEMLRLDGDYLSENSGVTGGPYPSASGIQWDNVTDPDLDWATRQPGVSRVTGQERAEMQSQIDYAKDLGATPSPGHKTGGRNVYDGLNATRHPSALEHIGKVDHHNLHRYLTQGETGNWHAKSYNPARMEDGTIDWTSEGPRHSSATDWAVNRITNRNDGDSDYYMAKSSSGDYKYIRSGQNGPIEMSRPEFLKEFRQDTFKAAEQAAYKELTARGVDWNSLSTEERHVEFTKLMNQENVAKAWADEMGIKAGDYGVGWTELYSNTARAMNEQNFWDDWFSNPDLSLNPKTLSPELPTEIRFGSDNQIEFVGLHQGRGLPRWYNLPDWAQKLGVNALAQEGLSTREYKPKATAIDLPPEYHKGQERDVSLGGGVNRAPRTSTELAAPIPLPDDTGEEPATSIGGGVDPAPRLSPTELPDPFQSVPIPDVPDLGGDETTVSIGGGLTPAPRVATELPSPDLPTTPEVRPEPPTTPEVKPEPSPPTTPEVKPEPSPPTTPEFKPEPSPPATPEVKPEPEPPATPELELDLYLTPPGGGDEGGDFSLSPSGVGYEDDLLGVEYREEVRSSPNYSSARKGMAYRKRGNVSVI